VGAYEDIPLPFATNVIISPPLTVRVAAGQSVYVSGKASVYNVSGGMVFVDSYIVYRPVGGAFTTPNNPPSLTVSLEPGGGQGLLSADTVISGLAPGTYQVALNGVIVGGSTGAVVRASAATISALVFQT
jgi:hypothetical protein